MPAGASEEEKVRVGNVVVSRDQKQGKEWMFCQRTRVVENERK